MHEANERRGPIRTCVGCRETAAPEELVRFVLGPDGSVSPDLRGGAQGRGAWVHPRSSCLGHAAQRGFSKSWRTEVKTSVERLSGELRAAANRRVAGLLAGAIGAKKVVLGATAVKEELAQGRCELLIVATDARAAVESREVERAVAAGLAVAWGTKAELGAATGRNDVGVVGVLNAGIARALRQSVELSQIQPKSGDVLTEE